MKVFIAQLNPRIGDFPAILSRMLELVEDGRSRGARVVVFPELAACGYPPRDLLDSAVFIDENLKVVEALTKASTGIAIVCGFVERNPSAHGKPYFNAAAVLDGGRRIATAHKALLPYYDVFDEQRHFEPGEGGVVFSLDGEKIALTICEDVWNLPGYVARLYGTSPLETIRRARPSLMIHLSASPFELKKPQKREALFSEVAEAIGCPIAVSGQAGANDELIFDGGSLFVTAKGDVLARARAFVEDTLIVEPGMKSRPSELPAEETFWIASALECGVRDYVRKSGMTKVVLGLSGGIDSSVVAAVAAKALGPGAVLGIALPTRFTAKQSLDDAETVAKRLGVAYRVFSIEETFESFARVLPGIAGGKLSSLTLENLQPRLRMAALMAVANEEGRLLLNTSNKSEIATGYATLYGDSAGALAVLGDLLKRQVYALARHYNRDGEVIPERVIARPPTAELRENQTDQDTLPPYDALDTLVAAAIEESLSPAQLKAKYPEHASWVDGFFRLYRQSEYKRRQLPPALRISSRAFGMGRRIPVTARFPQP